MAGADPGGMGIAGGFGGLLAAAIAIEDGLRLGRVPVVRFRGRYRARRGAAEEAPGRTVESFNDRYDRVMMAEEEEEEEEEE